MASKNSLTTPSGSGVSSGSGSFVSEIDVGFCELSEGGSAVEFKISCGTGVSFGVSKVSGIIIGMRGREGAPSCEDSRLSSVVALFRTDPDYSDMFEAL